MPSYRIHRIKASPGEQFRWASHTAGPAIVRPKDYEVDFEVQASSPYGAWKLLLDQGSPLRPGDLLEAIPPHGASNMFISKYVGFEEASWYNTESKETEQADSAGLVPN